MSNQKPQIKYRLSCPDQVDIFIEKKELDMSPTLIKLFENEGLLEEGEYFTVKLLADGKSVSQVVNYLRFRANEPEEHKNPDYLKKMITEMDAKTMFDVIHTANYLQVQDIVETIRTHFKEIISNQNEENIRKIFGLVNDFDPDELAEFEKEPEWN